MSVREFMAYGHMGQKWIIIRRNISSG
jgi:hypothetical protein